MDGEEGRRTPDEIVSAIEQGIAKDDKVEYAIFGMEEAPDTGRKHLQGFVYWTNAVTGRGAQRRLGLASGEFHAEAQRGTHAQASDYAKKDAEIIIAHGEIPDPEDRPESAWDYILMMVESGASDLEIMRAYPAHFARCKAGITAIRTELAFQHVGEYRDIQVTYLWGPTGTGKTRSVLESADHPRDVYKVHDYKHPFDGYRGQDIILFDEFRSSLKLEHMLNYIDGYCVELPCRYHNKVSQWTQVYIVSNLPFEEQYPSFQDHHASVGKKQSYDAWVRRIDAQVHKGHLEGNNNPLGTPEDFVADADDFDVKPTTTASPASDFQESFVTLCERRIANQKRLAQHTAPRVSIWEDRLGHPLEGDTEWHSESE